MDKNIYKFIFYLLFFVSFESYGQLMFINYKANVPVVYPTVSFGDIVFNELMADPTPVVKLPNAEYIEVRNTTNLPVNLKNWVLEVNGRQKLLPEKTIDPNGYLIVGATGSSQIWISFGANLEVTGLSIANTGANLKLLSSSGMLIDSLTYKPSMHQPGFDDGGYSLERIDPRRWCGVGDNWKTSISPNGGTPGAENSVFRDNKDGTAPTINSVKVISTAQLDFCISERPDASSLAGNLFSIQPALPATDSIHFDNTLLKYSLYFPAGSIANGVDYILSINGLTDECGNRSPVLRVNFWHYLPQPGDVFISEVLFNPFPGGVDFVEIYNSSGRKIELSELFLGARDKNHAIKPFYPLLGKSELLFDARYAAFTSDSAILLSNYGSECPECIFKMDKFPGYNLDEGWVVLLNRELKVMDEFHYTQTMHHPLISDVKGISLERSSFLKSSNDPSNWHSASQTKGFATPGYRNSTYEIVSEKSEQVAIEPKIFSPNDDGINDRLFIQLSQGVPGMLVNIRIYNKTGVEIRRLTNNLTAGNQDIIEWDGTTDNHRKAAPGIYLIRVELFGLQSQRKLFKAAVVLTDRLE